MITSHLDNFIRKDKMDDAELEEVVARYREGIEIAVIFLSTSYSPTQPRLAVSTDTLSISKDFDSLSW